MQSGPCWSRQSSRFHFDAICHGRGARLSSLIHRLPYRAYQWAPVEGVEPGPWAAIQAALRPTESTVPCHVL
ncbi:hypothetical protein QC762_0072980 [Podospora pseudocomata]|uniref:Uncharacterized protein n=1 Tax=Podospora pseudocomata TaxID=2093779 RepID=A0ABR0GHU3_9PEZI|nr:hypothetical protein QC762_0072980 [Podospora pseudocomata]